VRRTCVRRAPAAKHGPGSLTLFSPHPPRVRREPVCQRIPERGTYSMAFASLPAFVMRDKLQSLAGCATLVCGRQKPASRTRVDAPASLRMPAKTRNPHACGRSRVPDTRRSLFGVKGLRDGIHKLDRIVIPRFRPVSIAILQTDSTPPTGLDSTRSRKGSSHVRDRQSLTTAHNRRATDSSTCTRWVRRGRRCSHQSAIKPLLGLLARQVDTDRHAQRVQDLVSIVGSAGRRVHPRRRVLVVARCREVRAGEDFRDRVPHDKGRATLGSGP